MGLDMYLNKKTYVGNNYKDKEDQVPIKVKNIKQERVTEIVEQVGYWRKANAIHGWIVDNVQDGEDNCEAHYMDLVKIEELLDLTNRVLDASKLISGRVVNGYSFYKNGKKKINWGEGKVIKDPAVAKKLLPVREGFFFGSYDEDTAYDEWYVEDLKSTKEILEKVIAEGGDFYYQSSW